MMTSIRNNKTAIVLGGTNPHIALIENLKSRGFHTVLVDYFENPPAKKVADVHIRETNLDKEVVLSIAKKFQASLVISTCLDHQNAVACYVAEKMGLPAPYSYEVALNVTNKGLMKKKMIEHGIPTSKYIYTDTLDDFDKSGLKFPVVVKPADSNGSKGVRKADNIDELITFFNNALFISRVKQVIIEEFIEGKELSVDCFVNKNKVDIIMIREKLKMKINAGAVLQITGSIAPASILSMEKMEIDSIANKVSNVFELIRTPILLQMIVNDHGVYVLEIAARVGGGLSFKTVNKNTGFDILDAAIDAYLCNNVIVEYHTPDKYYAAINMYALPCEFGSIVNHQELINNGIIQEFFYYMSRGMSIGKDMTSADRPGAFLVEAKTRNELLKKIFIAIDKLEIYDINNSPIMIKDIYKFD